MPTKGRFLGSNSYSGFYSLSHQLQRGDRLLFIIKGGPGSGKSSFMRRISQVCGNAESVFCSGDPNSLDALILPQLGYAFADGTSPHVIEPEFAGISALYIDLSQFCDYHSLRREENAVVSLSRQYRRHYASAYIILSEAGEIDRHIPLSPAQKSIAKDTAKEIIGPSSGIRYTWSEAFASALSCAGRVSLSPECPLPSRRILLDGSADYASEVILNCAEMLPDSLVLRCPLRPQRACGLISPQIALCAKSSLFPPVFDCSETIALPEYSADFPDLYYKLLSKAEDSLRAAKNAHDELEAIYNPYTDFDAVYDLADSYARRLTAFPLTSKGK